MSNSLIFIDSRLQNRADLLKKLPTDSIVIELNANQDGLQQIVNAVSGYSNLDSIHIISHGSAGALYLGNSVLNNQTLPNYSNALSTIGDSLSNSGDILLYGCNVAEGETGAAFIAQLAQATGADVATPTGQNGDWELEAQQGTIESQVLELKGVETLSERDFTILSQSGGIVITDLGGADWGNSLSVQADGKILFGGEAYYTNGRYYDFALVRYNADGSLDTSFSGDGMLTTDLSGYDYGYSLTLQTDGKILLGGFTYNGRDSYFALARYNTDGSLDTSFSDDGMLTTDLGGNDRGDSLSVQADGKILLGGTSNYDNFVLVRYNTDGSLDTSFSGDGMLTTDLGGSDWGNSTSLQADGKILLGGHSGYDFALARYNTDGNLDTSFSDDGILTTDLGGNDRDDSLSVQADGKILLGGTSDDNFALVRYNTDGSLDTSFSTDGILTTDLGGIDWGRSLSLQADGKILLGGCSSGNFALARYNSDGSLDTSFSSDGKLTTDLGSDYGNSLTLQTDGKILLGGYSDGNFALVRYNTDGSVDTSFGKPTGSFAITGTATQGQMLTAMNAVIDPNGINSAPLRYQWLADGQTINGAIGKTFELTQAQVGKTISLQLDYTDSVGLNKSLLSASTLAVTNVNDAPSGSLTISGTAAQNETLTAISTLADADGLGEISYQWLADNVAVEGETTSTFTLTQAQVGKTISVKACYTDASGTAESVTSTATSTVLDINDAPTGIVIINGTIQGNALLGHELTAINSLQDTDGLGAISYQWFADGVAIVDATNATFMPIQSNNNQSITVKASYIDNFGHEEFLQSQAIGAASDVLYGDIVHVGSNDHLQGGIFASDLYGYAGDDELRGGTGDDRLYSGYGDDLLHGEADNDELYGDAGNDTLTGGTGKDSLYGGDGNDVLDGSSDQDFMDGGNGADTYYVDNAVDVVRDSGTDSGKDVLYITAYLQGGYVLGAGLDNAVLAVLANNASLTGNAGKNVLTGNGSNNQLKGGAGADTLSGGAGNDTLVGGEGKDMLNGGEGKDVFKLEKLVESGTTVKTRDIIQSFTSGQDKISLASLDANTQQTGNQSFTDFISAANKFDAAGQLQFKNGVLYGNTDGDSAADFSIALTGVNSLAIVDIIA